MLVVLFSMLFRRTVLYPERRHYNKNKKTSIKTVEFKIFKIKCLVSIQPFSTNSTRKLCDFWLYNEFENVIIYNKWRKNMDEDQFLGGGGTSMWFYIPNQRDQCDEWWMIYKWDQYDRWILIFITELDRWIQKWKTMTICLTIKQLLSRKNVWRVNRNSTIIGDFFAQQKIKHSNFIDLFLDFILKRNQCFCEFLDSEGGTDEKVKFVQMIKIYKNCIQTHGRMDGERSLI